jgi:hypothetical protein
MPAGRLFTVRSGKCGVLNQSGCSRPRQTSDEKEYTMRRATALAALAAGFVGAATLPAAAQDWGWGWNHGWHGGPYAAAPCTCAPGVAYRSWGYAPDYAYAYAPGYAYGYDYDYYPGVSVGFGFASDWDHRHRFRSAHSRGDRHWRGDRQRFVSRDRDFISRDRDFVRGDANFRGDTTIRTRGNRAEFSGDVQTRARVSTEGRGGRNGLRNAEFRGDAQMRGRGMNNGAAMEGRARGGMR